MRRRNTRSAVRSMRNKPFTLMFFLYGMKEVTRAFDTAYQRFSLAFHSFVFGSITAAAMPGNRPITAEKRANNG